VTNRKTAIPFIEKRRYFRINDVIGLSYAILRDGENPQRLKLVDSALATAILLAEIDREFNQATNILWHENPTMAQAFGLLNRKVSLLAEQSLTAQDKDRYATSYKDLQVNISACGMAFHCTEQLEQETRLQLSVQLKPSNISLRLTGSVIACEHLRTNAQQNYWVRISFDESSDAVREQLIQHIVQKQCSQLNEKEPNSDID